MANFHISKDGTARKCAAQSPESCRATRNDFDQHYETREDAQKAYEQKMEEKEKVTKSISQRKAEGNKKAEDLLARVQTNGKTEDFLARIKAAEEATEEAINDTKKNTTTKKKKTDLSGWKKVELPSTKETADFNKRYHDDRDNLRILNNEAYALQEKRKAAIENEDDNVFEIMREETDASKVMYEKIKKFKNDYNIDLNEERGSTYDLNTCRRVLAQNLERENEQAEEEIKKLEKSGRLKSAFNAEFKKEKEEKLQKMNDRLSDNEKLLQEMKAIEWSINNNKRMERRQGNIRALAEKGYKTATHYSGYNMSMHPQGPLINFSCGECYATSQIRILRLRQVRDIGFLGTCNSCGQRTVIPITMT